MPIIKKAAAAIYGWEYPLLTFIYPGFDCGSPEGPVLDVLPAQTTPRTPPMFLEAFFGLHLYRASVRLATTQPFGARVGVGRVQKV